MPDKILMTGNEAMGEAAIQAGCRFYAGYPITPQNELTAYMARRLNQEGGVFIQAESELAAINMVFGASCVGSRAMTSSSSPGMSLKQEGISYLAGCELPAVIINVMRGGPGLGNIASSQADYFQATRGGGHGDYFTPVLAPFSVEEAVHLTMLAFDLADYYRTPVLVLADAIIGQMMEAMSLPSKSGFKKKILPKNWTLGRTQKRSSSIVRSLFLKEGALEEHNERLRKKWERIRRAEQRSALYRTEGAKYIIISYGSQARIATVAVDILRNQNVKAGLFRPITLWPYPERSLVGIADKIDMVFVVEQSLGQMVEDVRLSLPGKKISFLGRAGGGVPTAKEIVRFVKSKIARKR
ncbi:MAG: 3-methyl-2-oxobutanoate dehydrogenase subunit VorB [Candidatus Omnitrophota bacterium]|nr:MAG: 3-methyl-2-oxobutanoate dehydrogenase subunit VorB [Candidatus Omnitrophota bacterium]